MITPKEITEVVSKILEVNYDDVIGKKRKPKGVVLGRKLSMFFCKELLFQLMSLKDIGVIFGNKDHATVIHHHKTTTGFIESNDKYIVELVNKISTVLNNLQDNSKIQAKMLIGLIED